MSQVNIALSFLEKNPLGNPTCKPEFLHSRVLSEPCLDLPSHSKRWEVKRVLEERAAESPRTGAHRPDISPMSQRLGCGCPGAEHVLSEKDLLSATPPAEVGGRAGLERSFT